VAGLLVHGWDAHRVATGLKGVTHRHIVLCGQSGQHDDVIGLGVLHYC